MKSQVNRGEGSGAPVPVDGLFHLPDRPGHGIEFEAKAPAARRIDIASPDWWAMRARRLRRSPNR